jgi:hypothetical protein
MGIGLVWFGRACLVVGFLVLAASVVMHFVGLSASYNIGDPSKFQFILISFWQIGIAIMCVGAVSILAGRRL